MRSPKLAAAALLALVLPAAARANPFDPARVPADAKYVVHLDMDRVRDTKLWPQVDGKLKTLPEFVQNVKKLAAVTDMTFPQDLHDVTLYGNRDEGEPKDPVVVVHGHMDRNRMLGLLQAQGQATVKPLADGHDLVTWHDGGQDHCGAFVDDSTVVIGSDEAHVAGALAVFANKAKAVKVGQGVAAGVKERPLLYLGVSDVQSMRLPADSPLVKKVAGGWLALDESGDDLAATGRIEAVDEASAKQIAGALNGGIAMVGLMSDNTAGDPHPATTRPAVAWVDLLKTAVVKANGGGVDLTWTVPESTAKQLVDEVQHGRHAVKIKVEVNPGDGADGK